MTTKKSIRGKAEGSKRKAGHTLKLEREVSRKIHAVLSSPRARGKEELRAQVYKLFGRYGGGDLEETPEYFVLLFESGAFGLRCEEEKGDDDVTDTRAIFAEGASDCERRASASFAVATPPRRSAGHAATSRMHMRVRGTGRACASWKARRARAGSTRAGRRRDRERRGMRGGLAPSLHPHQRGPPDGTARAGKAD